MIEDGRSGALIAAGDRQALAGAVCHLISNAEVRISMGRAAATAAAERYSIEGVVDAIEAVYRELISHRSQTSHGLP
jgi:glycosyltransferase involved in cell wall biosynthesis